MNSNRPIFRITHRTIWITPDTGLNVETVNAVPSVEITANRNSITDTASDIRNETPNVSMEARTKSQQFSVNGLETTETFRSTNMSQYYQQLPITNSNANIESKSSIHMSIIQKDVEDLTEETEVLDVINQIYERRLTEVAENGCDKVALATYEEWVNSLIKMNKNILDNTADLESGVAKLLLKEKQCRLERKQNEKQLHKKYYNDMYKLIQIYRIAKETGEWKVDTDFETINKTQFLEGFLKLEKQQEE